MCLQRVSLDVEVDTGHLSYSVHKPGVPSISPSTVPPASLKSPTVVSENPPRLSAASTQIAKPSAILSSVAPPSYKTAPAQQHKTTRILVIPTLPPAVSCASLDGPPRPSTDNLSRSSQTSPSTTTSVIPTSPVVDDDYDNTNTLTAFHRWFLRFPEHSIPLPLREFMS